MDKKEQVSESELFKLEQENYEKLAKKYPDQMVRSSQYDPATALQYVGITGVNPSLTGYLRYYPQDFIVEELKGEGDQTTIDPSTEPFTQEISEGETIYADLVKIGIGTFEAINQLSSQVGISPQKVGYAGMKDGRALTSQRVSIRGTTVEKLNALPKSHFFIKPKQIGKGAISPGQLVGNRFTITVRTEQDIDEQAFSESLQKLGKDGFPNFFGTQRFGHRLINPHLGLLLSQGKPEEAIRAFLVGTSPFDVPIYKSMRVKAKESYGDWQKMKKTFDILPYKFRHERLLLDALIAGDRPTQALLAIQDQVRFWFYSYGSFLVNQFLSQAMAGQVTSPDPLPLPQTSDEADRLFDYYLERDNTKDYQEHLRPYPFLRRRSRTIPPWITPQIHGHAISNKKIVVVNFSLPKAVYATTFLMFLFRLHGGNPIPTWVEATDIDAKKEVGAGSVTATLEKLEPPTQRRVVEGEI
ncbi:MAG: tRNA pseudouridine(13) synthase TruD [Candidatus Andersenbacteria bacterium]|nr:tRNA pseudouridine(13) synthase TruD [Candidatus Andersenbacteria bacterium]MBI3250982.1 tRNA pseudouridine(13) synthase TruD [Candidatus Andersenbacteria bacterium]